MLFLNGSCVYTSFRKQQLLLSLKESYPTVQSLEAVYGYFVDANEPLSTDEQARLAILLDAKVEPLPTPANSLSVWVIPRLGTISPWSSKATDIIHNCGLSKINRVERGIFYWLPEVPRDDIKYVDLLAHLYDPLIESVLIAGDSLEKIFQHPKPATYAVIDALGRGSDAFRDANKRLGLSLSDDDIAYLSEQFQQLNRNPTDVELMMFAQVNSEHCRHKIFNAQWIIDGNKQARSLFSMIRHTHEANPQSVVVAYSDNAAVLKAQSSSAIFGINPKTQLYEQKSDYIYPVLKVETHNHPTAISPLPGAATGSGGEIRDECATGRGAQAKISLTGFSLSHLHIPEFAQPWEIPVGKPKHLASALDIILKAPIGSASFNNEFGRPAVCGYFRTLTAINPHHSNSRDYYGYHKPIMIAGGIGEIQGEVNVKKESLPEDALLLVLGGPGMAIGLGGGAASSRWLDESSPELDFSSVQRANAEMERRTQEVIRACFSLGVDNPILSIHDVGAGGLSNAFPELVDGANRGALFNLRAIPIDEAGMTPAEIWCNESQERFVLAILPPSLDLFRQIAERERCPFAVIGTATTNRDLLMTDDYFNNNPVDLPSAVLFEGTQRLTRKDQRLYSPVLVDENSKINKDERDLDTIIKQVLQYPCVADKSFLITIGDRTVGGLVARDSLVGPWQTPVSDLAVALHDYSGYRGDALAMGERSPVAILNPVASARLAIGEAITNIAAALIDDISDIVLSANWMAAPDLPGEGAALYEAVQAIALELCPALGISIPVGKDSLSMQTTWQTSDEWHSMKAPLSLIITATAAVSDARRTLTPELQRDQGETLLVFIDLNKGKNPLGASVFRQTNSSWKEELTADVDNASDLRSFFQVIQALNKARQILAYHDRSDGGLFVTLCEMAFAARVGITIDLTSLGEDPIAALFSEGLGAVIQIRKSEEAAVFAMLKENHLNAHSHVIGTINHTDTFVFNFQQKNFYQSKRIHLQRFWSETSYRIKLLRDNPADVQQEYDHLLNESDRGLNATVSFDPTDDTAAPYIKKHHRPRVAILREQGVNGHMEMAAAFYQAGFNPVDVHMTDLIDNRKDLSDFVGLVAGGGFSYGDVLGAGRGWAQTILQNALLRDQFSLFFEDKSRFALGVCNGCQMFAELKSIIPGADHWPLFKRNRSEQFEARLSMVKVNPSPSLFFSEMVGSILPVAVAHGEGRVFFEKEEQRAMTKALPFSVLQYVDSQGQVTESYPYNPNGSSQGVTGLTTSDGRITILMPHPERVFRTVQLSSHPADWDEYSPWMRMFRNARRWCG